MTYDGPNRRGSDTELAVMRSEFNSMKADMAEMKQDVKGLIAIANQTKGGWWTIIAVGALAGSLGAFIGKLLPVVGGLPR